MVRALARVDLGAIERNCARLAAVAAPARLCAVVKAYGYGHGAVPAARAAQAGGAAWLAVATAAEAAELRGAGIDGPLLVMGALADEELAVALARPRGRGRLARGLRRRAARSARRARQARQRDGPARYPRPRRGVAGRARRGRSDRRPDDALRHRRRGRPRLPRGAAAPVPALDRPPPRRARARRQLGCHAARAGCAVRPGALRDRGLRHGSVPRNPADHGLEPALELVSYVAEVKRAGRARAPATGAVRGRARDVARHAADRVRRRRPPRAHQQRRRAGRRPPCAAGRDRVDGQHHRRPRRRAGAARHRGGADRRSRRRADPGGGGGRAARHHQLRGHLRDLRPGAEEVR